MAREESEKFTAPADFDGPTKNRHCTDILCVLLLIAAWVCMTGIGIHAMQNGDYRLVVYPLDYEGNVCGTDFAADMRNYSKLLYVNSYTGGVCVKECPDFDKLNLTDNNTEETEEESETNESNTTDKVSGIHADIFTLITYDGVWQPPGGTPILDPDFIQVADYSNATGSIGCSQVTCYPNADPKQSWTSIGIRKGLGYAFYAGDTYELLMRCYLTQEAEDQIAELTNANETVSEVGSFIGSTIDDAYGFWNKLYADIYIARKYVLGFGFGVSLGISLVYIYLMRFPGLLTTIIWTSILISIGIFFAGGYYAWNTATEWSEADPQTVDDNTINVTSGAAIAMFVIGGILALLACCLRQAIMDAILCTKEAGRAVNSMVLILLVPVVQTFGFFLFMIPFIWYSVNLASMAEISTVDISVAGALGAATGQEDLAEDLADNVDVGGQISIRVYEFDDFTSQCGWFMLFCLYWTANFVVAVGDMIIAMSVAKWYFTRNKLTIGSWTVIGSIIDTLWYHTGTCAYGSLIVAIIQLIRSLIAKAQKKAKEADSKVAQAILCCCQCFFWCLECCMKFINKNAYIQTAIFSTSFCKSCRESFYLIFRNAARVGAVSYVSSAVLIVGKLFISSVVTVLGYYVIVENMAEDLYSVGGPVAIIFLLSYWISDMFMDVLDMGILTVLHCFIADEEMFDGEERYSEKGLKDYVDEHGGVAED